MDTQSLTSINPPHQVPRLLSAGHFRTRPGYCTIRDNGRPDWLLFYTLAGAGRIVHLDGALKTRCGDCVIYPPGVPQDYRLAPQCEEWEFMWAHFLPWTHWFGLMSWPLVYRGIKYLHVDDANVHGRVIEALDRMCQSARGPMKQRELFAMNALEEAFLWLNSINPDLAEAHLDRRIRTAMDFVCRSLHRKLSLDEIGRTCGLSVSRLSHLFREQTGLTPQQYIEQRRIARARELLEVSSFSIAEIADQVGYESPFYFSRRFANAVGEPPRRYRRRHARQ
ncbi:MAG: helix-turn-helix domain-containing protein [Chitinivibrionales bacterium]|nr:helix-turn-helix domain-containing protein [Chitinivibrionales bacterium]